MIENLKKIKDSKILTSPFPHLVVDNFLDKEIVNELHNEFRENLNNEKLLKNANKSEAVTKHNVKQFGAIDLDEKILKETPKFKKSLTVNSFFNSQDFMNSIINKLSGYLSNSSGLSQNYFSQQSSQLNFNSRLCFVPPSEASKRRESHLDAPNNILIFLYYLRLPEDYSFGGSLNLLSKEERYLFKSRSKTFLSDLLNIYPSDLNIEKTYDYIDNRLVVMCSSGYSWHEVSTRRYAETPRINFHGGLQTNENNNEFTRFYNNKSLGHPLKSKLKYLLNFFNK